MSKKDDRTTEYLLKMIGLAGKAAKGEKYKAAEEYLKTALSIVFVKKRLQELGEKKAEEEEA